MKARPTENVARFLATARCLLDIIPDGVVIIVPSGHYVYANPSAARFLGLSVEDLIGLHAEEVNESGWHDIARVFEDGKPQIGARSSYKGKLYIASRLPIKLDGEVQAVVSFFQGVFTYDTYALELESYKQMAKMLDAIMESSYDGLWITDKHGNVVKLNKAAQRITGCNAEEVLGRNVSELVKAGYVDESVTHEVLKRKTTVTMVQKTKLNKKVLATGNPILDSRGDIDVIIINDRDITELDRMRQDLEDSKALVDLYRHELSDMQLRELQLNYHLCKSKVMETVYEKALRASRFDSTVLLTGESGVGKGFLAKLIHQKSDRPKGPFIRVDCGAIVETLFESELFGHEKGAFTGAGPRAKLGMLETAQGGTLFLDEIAEVPLTQQVKLLRFLDEKNLIRVGGSEVRRVDTRVIAATNKDLGELVRKHRFRRDLFYRLNVVALLVPPLRERTEDILDLITFFMNRISQKHQLRKQINREALDVLLNHDYPGNVRELENIVESTIVMCPGDTITLDDLPGSLRQSAANSAVSETGGSASLPSLIRRTTVEHIQRAIDKYGSQRKAALHLGVHQSTVSRLLKKHQQA